MSKNSKSKLNNSYGVEALKYLKSQRNLNNKIIDDFKALIT